MKTDIDAELRARIIKELQEAFPYGHADFIPMTLQEMALHSAKNYDYAHGGDPLGNFDRVAAIFSNYPGLSLGNPVVVALAYAMKQLDSTLWQLCQGYEGKVEGLKERLGDVSVYAKLAIILAAEQAKEAKEEEDELIKLVAENKALREKLDGYEAAIFGAKTLADTDFSGCGGCH